MHRRTIVVAVALFAMTATTTWTAFASEPKVSGEIWYQDGLCLNGFAKTRHGPPVYRDPNSSPTQPLQSTGEFHNEAVSVRDHDVFWLGGTIHCWAAREKNAGELAVRSVILKWQKNGPPGVCAIVEWIANSVRSHAWSTNVGAPVGRPGMCGRGDYKVQAYQRMFESGRWVPAVHPCDATRQNNCIAGIVTPEWHWFPIAACHDNPDACVQP